MGRLLVIVIVIAAIALAIYYMNQSPNAPLAPVSSGGNSAMPTGGETAADLFSAADGLYMKSDYERAIATYRKAISMSPGDSRAPEGGFRIADSYEKEGKPGDALKAYKEFAAKYPTDERMNKVQKRIDYLTDTGAGK